MKLTLIFTFLILTICSNGQPKNDSKIQNSLTPEHVNIKGTKISVIPPNGWTVASNFNGFQQTGSSSSLMVVEIPGPFEEVSKGLTEEGLKTQGVILDKKRTVTVNGYSGLYVVAKQFAYETMFGKYILVFGNDQTTFIINGMFPRDFEKELGSAVEKSMLSVVYEPNKEINPLKSVNFEIDVSNSKFKFAQMMSNTLLYTADGNVPTKSDDKTTLMVGTSLGKIKMEDEKQYAINRMKQYPSIKNIESKQINSITIDDISGYEIIANGIDSKTGEPEMIYQIMLFSDNAYYLIVGVANTEFEENIELFKKIGKTFKRK
jgi:hypothetical protein